MKVYFGYGFVDVFVGMGYENHSRINIVKNPQFKEGFILHRVKGNALERADYFNLKEMIAKKIGVKK